MQIARPLRQFDELGEAAVVGHHGDRVEPVGLAGVEDAVLRPRLQGQDVAGAEGHDRVVGVRLGLTGEHDEGLRGVLVGVDRLGAAGLPDLEEDAGVRPLGRSGELDEPDGVVGADQEGRQLGEPTDDGCVSAHGVSLSGASRCAGSGRRGADGLRPR